MCVCECVFVDTWPKNKWWTCYINMNDAANIIRGKVGCADGWRHEFVWLSSCPISMRHMKKHLAQDFVHQQYQYHIQILLLLKPSSWNHMTSNRLAKNIPCLSLQKLPLPPPYPKNQNSRTLSKHSGNAPVEKRWTNQVLPLNGLPITRIPACQSGSSAPRLGTNGNRIAKRHKYGTYSVDGCRCAGNTGKAITVSTVVQGIHIRCQF